MTTAAAREVKVIDEASCRMTTIRGHEEETVCLLRVFVSSWFHVFVISACVSEHHSNRSLHHARRARRDHLAEERVDLIARRVEARRRVHRRKLRVVEQVVDLPPKLQAPAV